jgi:transcriptional regulator with XRE-family HTH domain
MGTETQDQNRGDRLRARRRKLGLTQQQLASMADVAILTVIKAEQGKPLRPRIYQRITKALFDDAGGPE